MTIRSITQSIHRWRRKPRFGTPSLGIALLVFLAAALLMLLTRGPSDPVPPSQPPPLASRPRVEEPPPIRVPRFEPSENATPIPALTQVEQRCPRGCDVPPPDCFIKGNVSPRTGERIYHLPGQHFYGRTEITPGKGEAWFCTEEEARANGWRKAKI